MITYENDFQKNAQKTSGGYWEIKRAGIFANSNEDKWKGSATNL